MAVVDTTIHMSSVHIDEDEIAAAVAVLRSGKLREGAECHAFEAEFAEAVGSQHALTVNSGTAALQMAYAALIEPGDEVLVPAFTFFATASMVVAAGGVPVFCDIHADTLTIDLDDAKLRVNERTRAIAPVHIFGNACDVVAVQEFAVKHDLRIIWDAAQAHGTLFEGKDVGGFGDAVTYSFYPSKNMTTGEGGMVCTNDRSVAEKMKLVRSQGQSSKYYHTALGFNFRMTDFQAAIGRGQLRKLAHWVDRRRQNAAVIRESLSSTNNVSVQREQDNSRHAYHQFTVVLTADGLDRTEVQEALRRDGVESAVHYPIPLHQQPFFATSLPQPSLPVSENACRRVLSVPVHRSLDLEQARHVGDALVAATASIPSDGPTHD